MGTCDQNGRNIQVVRDRSRPQSVRRSRLPIIVKIACPIRCMCKRDTPDVEAATGRGMIIGECRTENSVMSWRRIGAHREATHPTKLCLRCHFSRASFVLSFGCGHSATTTEVPLQTPHQSTQICINSTSLSADRCRCQAHFFVTTFCVALALAEIDARCSAQHLRRCFRVRAHEIGAASYYLDARVLHSMKVGIKGSLTQMRRERRESN